MSLGRKVTELNQALGWLASQEIKGFVFLMICRASKAALNIINKSFVTDLAEKNIRCVLMHPGYVSTDMTGENTHSKSDH
jgi:NAD(P)-dependent dehydrogenase (short-subunit alcohol dehydrogenase family)